MFDSYYGIQLITDSINQMSIMQLVSQIIICKLLKTKQSIVAKIVGCKFGKLQIDLQKNENSLYEYVNNTLSCLSLTPRIMSRALLATLVKTRIIFIAGYLQKNVFFYLYLL